jgi:hypothetical protein
MKRFAQWCKNHNVAPHRASWQQQLACLSEYASNAVLSTRSIINMRSAISMNTSLVNGTPFGQLPEVQMFIKGLRRRNPVPQQPVHTSWDISDLVAYLKSMSPWSRLSLLQKGQKTHALLRLATGWRPGSDMSTTLASVLFEYSSCSPHPHNFNADGDGCERRWQQG